MLAESVEVTPQDRALVLFEQSVERYEAGAFDEAIDLLLEARQLYPEPVLLYNLARAYEGLGRLDEAVAAYVQYLDEAQDIHDRGAIERRVESLREQIDDRDRLAQEIARRDRDEGVESSEDRHLPPPLATRSPWPWVLLAVGLVSVATGCVFGGLVLTEAADAEALPEHRSAASSLDRAEDYALVFDLTVPSGSAVALAGLIWLIVERAQERRAER